MSTAVQPNFYPAGFDPRSASVVVHKFFDDFLDLNAGWTVTEDDGACTQAVQDILHGAVLLTNKATTDDNAQQITWAQETFKLVAGKRVYFEARIRAAAGATQIDLFMGLAEAEDLTGVADNMPANGLGIRKDDGDAYFDACSSDGGTNVESTQLASLVANTWTKVGFVFDGGASGSAKLYPFIDGVQYASVDSVTYATVAEMAPFFMVRNGDAVTTQTLEIDYVMVIAER